MTYRITNTLQQNPARVAGFMYLFALATGFLPTFIRFNLTVGGNAAETANKIMSSEQLFRIGLASDLIAFTSIVLLALALYILLKPVNNNLALLALFWWLERPLFWGSIR